MNEMMNKNIQIFKINSEKMQTISMHVKLTEKILLKIDICKTAKRV